MSRALALALLAALALVLCLSATSGLASPPGPLSAPPAEWHPRGAAIRAVHRFFSRVLDTDGDGRLSAAEYAAQLTRMDEGEEPPAHVVRARHAELDLDADGSVSAAEMCRALRVCRDDDDAPATLAAVLRSGAAAPQQLHLAAAPDFRSMLASWAQDSAPAHWPLAAVRWGRASGAYTQQAAASVSNYTVSQSGLTYTSLPLFTANLTGLQPNTRYFYAVGNDADGWSAESSFTSLPDASLPPPQQVSTRLVTYGDQGTAIPMGATVCGWVEAAHDKQPFGMMLHVGDLSYAGVSSAGEYEPTWDVWMQQIAPIASQMPYQVSVGNHESFFSFASYRARFSMPGAQSGGNGSFWWSMDHGSVHITSFSTESDFTPGSAQYQWIEQDFKKAKANPGTAWLVLAGHRPLYGSNSEEYKTHIPGCALLTALEPLLVHYGVDLVLTGHCHSYERMYPVINGTVYNDTAPSACDGQKDHERGLRGALADERERFWQQVDPSLPLPVYDRAASPAAPVYIVQATAGVLQIRPMVDPQPAWSAQRLVGTYGYGVLSASSTSSGCATLLYQFVTDKDAVVDQMMMVRQVGAPEAEQREAGRGADSGRGRGASQRRRGGQREHEPRVADW